MNEIIEKEIENMIYEIRGAQVMLDSDLAKLYNVETKALNRQVKRNIDRFPEDFCFQLSKDEYKQILRCQFGTLELKQGQYSKYLPYVFTEHGVTALSGVLHSDRAIEINIKIIRAFVKMRHFIIDNNDVFKSINHLNNKIIEHDEKIDYLFSKFDKKENLFIKGQVYDAYSNFVSIFKEADNELIVIDSYADNTFLDIIRKLECSIILITKNSYRLSDSELEKYNKQYHNLKIIRNNDFHDRYFIIDRKKIYQSGTSINNAGEKIFSINILDDKIVKNNLIEYVNEII